jgi:para-aminobenzoate synthetase component 1
MHRKTQELDRPSPLCTTLAATAFPLIEELSPAPDPWQIARSLHGSKHLLFLDSAAGPLTPTPLPQGERGRGEGARYSFVTAGPFAWLQARGKQVWLDGKLHSSGDPLAVLREQLRRWTAEPVSGMPPFQGGAAGLFGYDLCHHIERLPRPAHDEFETPDLAIGLYDWVMAFDHQQCRAWLISTGFPETETRRRRERAGRRMRQARRLLDQTQPAGKTWANGWKSSSPVQPSVYFPMPGLPDLASSFDRAGYLATIRRAIDYVHAGDCFQVNIAQRLLYPARLPPLELYGRLRERNPAPFAGYFDLGEFVIASSSPERFLRVAAAAGPSPSCSDPATQPVPLGKRHLPPDEVETRPIKGTRPRGPTPEEDQAQIAELQQSAKDRAENVMIVDLLRNDLGRVCQYGTVRVESVCRLETYKYVHHLVSVVRGRLRSGQGPIDLLRAAFPGGSVTGAPKVRAMEIIAELEPVARGPYCGSLGWIGFDGSMDTNLLIRTFTVGKGWVQFPVGGGIVADSVSEQEYDETWHKAEGLLRALR